MTELGSHSDCGVGQEQQEEVRNVTQRIHILAQDPGSFLADWITGGQADGHRILGIATFLFHFSCK